MKNRYLIVGAGFSGCVLASRLAAMLDCDIDIWEERSHLGGNCHTKRDDNTGIMVHEYGPHIFNTDKKEILRNAVKFFAEEAKIQLSFKDSHNILSNLGDLPFEDDNGEEPEIDVQVTQKDMENVVAPIFQKAIDITKD